jgi:hypothetical protein
VTRKAILPPGWDQARVERVLAHYERQGEDEALAEDEAVFGKGEPGIAEDLSAVRKEECACAEERHTAMEVPVRLLPAIRELIARHRGRHGPGRAR